MKYLRSFLIYYINFYPDTSEAHLMCSEETMLWEWSYRRKRNLLDQLFLDFAVISTKSRFNRFGANSDSKALAKSFASTTILVTGQTISTVWWALSLVTERIIFHSYSSLLSLEHFLLPSFHTAVPSKLTLLMYKIVSFPIGAWGRLHLFLTSRHGPVLSQYKNEVDSSTYWCSFYILCIIPYYTTYKVVKTCCEAFIALLKPVKKKTVSWVLVTNV